MKFGKHMQECLFYQWAEYYVNYTKLKKALKTGVFGRTFLDLLEKEVGTVETFFKHKERELSQALVAFEKRAISDLDVGFVELCNNLDRLREFVLVNYLAVRKIVKKHDKLCGPENNKIIMDASQLLSRCTFFKCPHLTATLSRMEGLLASVFISNNIEPQGSCSLCCRSSRHNIALGCQHRFCWACFATEMLPVCEHCIACGKETGLDPANFEIGRLLKTVGNQMNHPLLQTPPAARSWLETEAGKGKYSSLNTGTAAVLFCASPRKPVGISKSYIWKLRKCVLLMQSNAVQFGSWLWDALPSVRRSSLLSICLLASAIILALQQLWSKSQTARLDYLLCNIIYIAACVRLHVFVSPVAHSTVSSSPMPSYMLFVKVVHFWLLTSFVIFHLPLLEILNADVSDAASLLFPLFALNLPFLLLWDALARHGLFAFSYGRNCLELALNGLILSSACAFHSHYCTHVDLQLGYLTLCPAALHHHELLPRLLCFCMVSAVIFLVNYCIHRREQCPGILWGGTLETEPVAGDENTAPVNPPSMVSWYSIMQFSTVVNLLVTLKIFLGRFDIRVLHNKLRFAEESCKVYTHFADRDELWFDFVADVGDGFHSTYTIARLLAQPSLELQQKPCSKLAGKGAVDSKGRVHLPRGQLMVIGGDLAYPGPSYETFTQRFQRPFEDALPPSGSERQRSLPTNKPSMAQLASYRGPQAFCIPGNHDWYDGLETFLAMVCCSKWLGGWLLPQTTSYFALKLPHGWWLFGLDMGLNMDIDVAQFQYFSWVTEHYVGANDKVIVVTHEPGWILDNYWGRPTQKNVKDLVRYILGKRCVLRLAGDVHNYTRHVPVQHRPSVDLVNMDESPPQPILVVSGGGGAFMHPTHLFNGRVIEYDGQPYRRVAAYPSPKVSRSYGILNVWRFRQINWHIDVIGGTGYFLFVCAVFPVHSEVLDPIFNADGLVSLVGAVFQALWTLCSIGASHSIPLSIAKVLLLSILVAFVDGSVRHPKKLALGISHALCHVAGAFILCLLIELAFEAAKRHHIFSVEVDDDELYSAFHLLVDQLPTMQSFFAYMPAFVYDFFRSLISIFDFFQYTAVLRNRILTAGLDSLCWQQHVSYYAAIFLLYYMLAAPCMSLLFGIYLFICVTFLHIHWDEGYASLQIEHYKNFCRLHLKPNGDLEVFVIGVDHIPSQFLLDPHWGSCRSPAPESPNVQELQTRNLHFNGKQPASSAHTAWELGSNLSETRLDTTSLPPSYTWTQPSRWTPVGRHTAPQIIDHFVIPCSSETTKWL